ncbi:MAG: hypothetical protein KDA98_14070 [Acidimicrobiales bacterium]|nr:hypothetical protein [Acidimicrobiales bacterium]
MADATRPSDRPAPGSDPGGGPLEPWVRGLCPDDVIAELHELRTEGDLVMRWLTPWARAVDAAIGRYEASLATHPISDDLHRQLASAAGVTRLYALVDDLLEASSVT